jgi:WD40 repeat protein
VFKIAKRSKFNVNQTKKGKLNRTFEGIVYDSELELQYYKEVICTGLKNGSIKKFERQVKYELQPKYKYMGENILAVNYIADFVVTYSDNSVIVWDVKGLADATAKLKKKIFHYKYPDIDYRWIGFSKIDGGWREYKNIEKARSKRSKEKKANNKTIIK